MLNGPTIEKLKALRLDALCAAWAEQQKSPEIGQLSFDERLGLLVDAEHLARENKRLGRLLKEAKLRLGQACVELIEEVEILATIEANDRHLQLSIDSGLSNALVDADHQLLASADANLLQS